MVLVQALSEQMGVVRAEERLDYLNDTAVASGSVKKNVAQRHQRALVRHTKPEKRVATVEELAAMGIQFSG